MEDECLNYLSKDWLTIYYKEPLFNSEVSSKAGHPHKWLDVCFLVAMETQCRHFTKVKTFPDINSRMMQMTA